MNTEALFLFLIILLGLLLCSFLGGNCNNEGFTTTSEQNNRSTNGNGTTTNGNGTSTSSNMSYDNYNHFNGSSTQLASGTTFNGPNGGSVVVNTNSDGQQTLQVTLKNGQQPMTFTTQQPTSSNEGYTNYGNNGSATTFYGPSGATATVVNGNNGQQAINVQTSSGSYTYTESGTSTYNPNNTSSTQYYGSTGNTNQSASSSLAYQGPYGGSAGSVTGPEGNTAYYAQGPNGNTVAGTTNNDYYNSLPPGITSNQIPPGQEDLYILKSQVVPPVCPVCPVGALAPREEKCAPCPACARCPEPNFECKKVPNYNAIDNQYLPAPVLNDFSTFGM